MSIRLISLGRALTAAVLLFILCLAAAASAENPKYALVRVALDVQGVEATLSANPGLDIAARKPGHHVEIVALPKDLAWLDQSGIRYEVVEPDMETAYASRNKGLNFGLFHTYSETVTWLDELHALYPEVVSAKWSLGNSHLGNPIWCVRVSDNPETNETGEPEILFDALHHAREVMASETASMLVEYFGANYGVDPEITWLLDNREIYIVPIVNPDGFIYNETTNPTGGGMWRKNRRNNGDGSYGVDPNRNYPFQWVGPGSSTIPSDDTYRGPSAGSEPEVQAMMSLVNSHNFITSQSFHTYSNLTLYPWGYTASNSPDEAVFQHMAAIMTQYNGYEPGQAPDLLYSVNGGSFDWVYGASIEHPECLAFTNEIGSSSDGFWPDETRIDALFAENLFPSLYQVKAAGLYVQARTPAVVGGDGDAILDPGETAGLAFTLENLGVTVGATSVSVTLSCDDPYLQLHEAQRTVGAIGARSSLSLTAVPFSATLDAAVPPAHSVPVRVTVVADGQTSSFVLDYPAGLPVSVYSNSFESGFAGWTVTGTWALVTSSSHSATHSLHDSPAGNYVDNSATYASLNTPIAMPAGAKLAFWHKYTLESGYDYAYVQVSTNNTTWTTVATYNGTLAAWTLAEVDLGAYAGQSVYLRFRLETDSSVVYDGWYLDDLIVTGLGSQNQTPPPPALVSPYDGGDLGPTAELTAAAAVDPDSGDTVTYGFRVYRDALGTDPAARADDLTSPGFNPALTEDGTYWWRAYAADSEARGDLGDTWSFLYTSYIVGAGDALRGLGLEVLGGVTGDRAGIRLDLPRAGALTVDVYNARGQAVRRLHAGDSAAGTVLLTWDGRDDGGRTAPSGVYFVRARAGGEARVGRVVMVR
jgi:hypothetical protein